jgi:PrtD family type I secretion system ABC transporter
MSGIRDPKGEAGRALLRSCRVSFAIVGCFSFAVNVLMLASPLYMMQVYDRVLASRSEATLLALTAVVGFLLVVMAALDVVRARVLVRQSGRLAAEFGERVRQTVRQAALSGDEGAARPLRDFDTVRGFLAAPAVFAFFDAPWVPIYIAVVFVLHPLLGLVGLAGAILLFGLTVLNELVTRERLTKAGGLAARNSGQLERFLGSAQTLESMAMFSPVFARWTERRGEVLAVQAQASDAAGLLIGASKLLRLLIQVAVLGGGAWLAIHQEITAGTIIGASILVARGLAPIEQMTGAWKQLVGAREAFCQLAKRLGAHPPAPQCLSLPAPERHLHVEQLVIAAPNTSELLIKGISFELPAGRALAVLGPSGAGKSTLARALVGVWRPLRGTVRLDGADLEHWDRDQLGPHVGYLPQEVALFEGTVVENIARFGTPDAERVVAAAKAAGVHQLILRLPDGYGTEIGPGGARLSAGQRQRVALARTLYGDPVLIVLDDPDSNLDEPGEQALAAAIRAQRERGATVVVVSHRPYVLRSVDSVLGLADGKVAWSGDAERVLAARRSGTPMVAAAAAGYGSAAS